MRRGHSPRDARHEPILDRLDRVAENVNAYLILIIIGLALLDFTVFSALELPRLTLR